MTKKNKNRIKTECLFAEWAKEFQYFPQRTQGLILAYSGGLDSTVLLDLLLRFLKQHTKFDLRVCHINFGLRAKESDEDENFITELCKDLKVKFETYKIRAEERQKIPGESLQAWARKMRYQKFSKLAEEGWIITLAHHLDDLAENVLLRLARGTSPSALLGMQTYNHPYWRPLLSLDKKALEEWATRHNLLHREDSSNAKLTYSRNRVRHEVLPVLENIAPGAAKRMIRLAKQAAEIADFSYKQLLEDKDLSSLLSIKTVSRVKIVSKKKLRTLPEGVAIELLARSLGWKQKKRKCLSYKFLEDIFKQAHTSHSQIWSRQLPADQGKILLTQEDILLEQKLS